MTAGIHCSAFAGGRLGAAANSADRSWAVTVGIRCSYPADGRLGAVQIQLILLTRVGIQLLKPKVLIL